MASSLASGVQYAEVYHPFNPHAVTWIMLRTIVLDALTSHTKKLLENVPLHVWIAKVRKESESLVDSGENVDIESALRRNPAAKLIDFYEELASSETVSTTSQFEYSKILKLSKAMQGLEPIKGQ